MYKTYNVIIQPGLERSLKLILFFSQNMHNCIYTGRKKNKTKKKKKKKKQQQQKKQQQKNN